MVALFFYQHHPMSQLLILRSYYPTTVTTVTTVFSYSFYKNVFVER